MRDDDVLEPVNTTRRRTPHGIRQAFTLVEILIVVLILGILAAIVVPQFGNATQEARASNIKAQLTSIQNALELYAVQNEGEFPTLDSTTGWTALISGTRTYLKQAPRHPAIPTSGGSPLVDVSSVETASSGTGSETAAWLFNTTTSQIYASYFNEELLVMTSNATD